LIGLAVGAGAAALLLPASGQDTRRRIARTIGRGKDQVEEVAERTVREPEPEAQSAPSM
jgi:gas vesicle protein